MNMTAISMHSVTHAMKAQRLLKSQGYSCEIRRSSSISSSGCTHMILVNGAPEVITAFLDKYNIEYGKLITDGMLK